ncbi:MAG: SDR family NAD(P)-dependent oxidoreductase, partial [Pseudomonadota bacterium]
EILAPKLDFDIRALWLPERGEEKAADARLTKPSVQLPLIMIVEYALAQLWMSWGVKPAALVGHSMGENTAACVAGVMSFEDCIGLVHLRGTLFDTVPAGGMLSVPLSAEAVTPYLDDALDIGAVNAPDLTVVSGPQAALDGLEERLRADEVEPQRIKIDIAAHSRMLEPILERFGDYLRSITLNAPEIPFVSNRSGVNITDDEATDPNYWVGHLRNTVHFADCITTLSQVPGRVFLEVGPGRAMSSLAQANGSVSANQVVASLRHPKHVVADDLYFLTVIGRLWAAGVAVDWDQIWAGAHRHRVPLPTYQFRRSPYFIEPGEAAAAPVSKRLMRTDEMENWGWQPVWRQSVPDCTVDVDKGLAEAEITTWLFFVDDAGIGVRAAERLRQAGHRVVEVRPGDAVLRTGPDSFLVPPEQGRAGYEELIETLVADGVTPERIVHLWSVTRDESFRPGSSFFNRVQEQGFYSLLFLAQAIGGANLPRPLALTVVANGAMQVRDEALPHAEKATLLGPVQVIPRELPGVSCRFIDIELPVTATRRERWTNKDKTPDALAGRLLEDIVSTPESEICAWRGAKRFTRDFRPAPLPAADGEELPLRKGGTYLITGGFGGIGLTVAETLWQRAKANLVLIGRHDLPPREEWPAHIRRHGPLDPVSRRIKAVEHLESLGAQVMVQTADVCIRDDVVAVAEAARARFGGLNGVVHAAGTVNDGLVLAKTTPAVEDVFSPKIQGTRVLADAIPPETLDFMALFSSTSTVTAPAGQVDYVAANAFLNAFAKARSAAGGKVVAINWGIWQDVGMAAEALAARTGDTPEMPVEPAGMPLLDKATFDPAGNRLFTASYDTKTRWILNEHRTKARDALLPGTGYLELAAEALAAQGETGGFEIRDLTFFRPLTVDDGAARDVQVRLKRSAEGYALEVLSGVTVTGRPAFERNATATLALVPLPSPAALDLDAIASRCPDKKAAPQGESLVSPQEAHLAFGPRWRVIQKVARGEREGLAELALPHAFIGDVDAGYLMHPALLDLATGWAMELIPGYGAKHLWVPVSYGRVRVYRPLPPRIVSHIRLADGDGDFVRFDGTLADADGNVCVEFKDFTIRRLGEDRFTRPAPPRPADVIFADETGTDAAPLSPAEERLVHNLGQGIRSDEGGEAFVRALATGRSQIVVTSLDLPSLVAQAGEDFAEAAGDGQKFDRPELDSDYVAPSTDIERQLVGFWEELLGVDQIGVEDNFFDLGGHSLIAVRLFAQIRKAYKVDFPISVLFEAPTIAKCAALVAERTGASDADAATGESGGAEVVSLPSRRFTHLVPMHEGEGGPKTPFFMVAGMFGNVLNLRYLAYLIGTDRPF